MKNINKEKEINKIISSILNEPLVRIKPRKKARDFDNWDSLNNIKIYLKIKDIYNNLTISEYTKCKKIEDIYKVILRKNK